MTALGVLLLGCASVYAAGVVWFATGLRRLRPGAGAVRPAVSVVVAARDEEARIGRCLEALRGQDYPGARCELIVVDDGSRDRTAARVRSFPEVRLLHTQAGGEAGGSKKAALALGVEAATGELILTTDADCVPGPGWVGAMVRHFEPGVGMVAGFSRIGGAGPIRGMLPGYEAADFLALMGCTAGSIGHGRPLAASGQNLAYRREAFLAVGGYAGLMHRSSGDDVLLLQRIRRQGRWRIAFAGEPAAHVVHPPAGSVAGLLRQRVRWASNAPIQAALDPLFFAHLLAAWTLNALLVLSPALVAAGWLPGRWVLGTWAGKCLLETFLLGCAARRFERQELLRYVPLWLLAQPVHVAVVGLLGPLGVFAWKGSRHRWGRLRPGAGDGASTPDRTVTP